MAEQLLVAMTATMDPERHAWNLQNDARTPCSHRIATAIVGSEPSDTGATSEADTSAYPQSHLPGSRRPNVACPNRKPVAHLLPAPPPSAA